MELAISVVPIIEKESRDSHLVSKASTARNVSLSAKETEENVPQDPDEGSQKPGASAAASGASKTAVTIGQLSHAPVRGSSVGSDMAALTETIVGAGSHVFSQAQAWAPVNVKEGAEAGEPEHKKTASVLKARLDKNKPVKVEDWLSLDTVSYHPKYTSGKKHFLRIINTLDYDEKLMEVCNYMTINDLILLYESYNVNCRNCLWKNIWGKTLELNKSLDENGLIDYCDVTDETGLDMFPTILLYFKDGFENEPPMELDISQNPTQIAISGLLPHRNY